MSLSAFSKFAPGAVHLVDEGDARDLVLGRLAPDGFGLRLHAGDAAEHGDRAVEHAHGALDFGREIHVARRVDDVDPVRHAEERLVGAVVLLRPVAGRGRGGDGDAALALLLHPVGHGVAVVHVAHLVDEPGVKEDALGGRRLAGVDVRGDADVARALQRVLPLRRRCTFGFAGFLFPVLLPFRVSLKIKTPRVASACGAFELNRDYQRKWAKALLAWAILCTSSRLRIALPWPW